MSGSLTASATKHRKQIYRLTGLLLLLLCCGIILGIPAIRLGSPVHVSVDELIESPDRYRNAFIEVQGRVGYAGIDECLGSGLALFSATTPGKYIPMAADMSLDHPASSSSQAHGGFATLRGRPRWHYLSPCGLRATRYLDVDEIEFDVAPTP
jgi:hypothetical protein